MKRLLLALGVVLCFGCVPPKSPTDAERAAVVMTAQALHDIDQVCATLGAERKDLAMLTTCKNAYNLARPALVVAQYYVDSNNQAGVEQELCVAIQGVRAEADAVANAGTTVPPLVTEALNFAGSICGGK